MKISLLIKKLEEIQKAEGDLDVAIYDEDHNYYHLIERVGIVNSQKVDVVDEEIKPTGSNCVFLTMFEED